MNNFAFIDSQNLNLAIISQGWKLDFKKFRIYLKDKFDVTKAFLFIGYDATNSNLYTSLQTYGYILVFKPTLVLPNGKVKGNIDAELVLHTMIQYNNFDKSVVVTGDGDFFCLIEHLVKHNKLNKLLIPDKNKYSSLFRKFINNVQFMNGLKGKLEYK
jgi:uncharacterized LabA/DUF88 family protein